jgi:hypothetical protein
VLFHAQLIVICSTESELSGLQDRDLICRSRLGTAVKKTVVVAFLEKTLVNVEENGSNDSKVPNVVYRSLKRLNVKLKNKKAKN